MTPNPRAVFENSHIGSTRLRNRIFRSATHEGLTHGRGCSTERLIERYEALARHEAGCILSMSRPFISEPDIAGKLKEGVLRKSHCMGCNYCLAACEANSLKCYHGAITQ